MRALQRLRQFLQSLNLAGYIVPSTDEHQNEYTPKYNRRLEFLTGFNGSNGLCVILPDIVLFFTDGRYITQARQQIPDSKYRIFLLTELINFPWAQYIDTDKDTIGYDATLFNVAQLSPFITLPLLAIEGNLIDKLWYNRPAKPQMPAYLYTSEYSGESSEDKIRRVRQRLKHLAVNYYIVTDSTAISWLLNIRANDIPYCHMLPSWAIIDDQQIRVFVDLHQITPELRKSFDNLAQFVTHDRWSQAIATLRGKVLIDNATCSVFTRQLLHECQIISQDHDLISMFKNQKNDIELKHFKEGHILDAIALCEFFAWLQENISASSLTEYDLTIKICEYRRRASNYIGESFFAICGYLENSAVIHYRPQQGLAKAIEPFGILLVDTGAHYLGCTTDITRVIAFSTPTDEQRLRYTQVLKGHIDLAAVKFPIGTTGSHLDVLARKYLWDQGLNYSHSTGHGVGSMLSVHEGPVAIRSDNQIPLAAGMILSNEPGYYIPGQYGFRIENLMAINHATYPGFLEFCNLTLVPYCHALIDYSLLTIEQLHYLSDYYSQICKLVSPHLSFTAQSWVEQQMKVT